MRIGSGRLGARAAAREAVIEIYRAHYYELARFARVLVRDSATAEDIAQEAFARLYMSWDRVREPERAVGYLRITILNLARSRGRRISAARRHQPDAAADAASAEEDFMGNLTRGRVMEAVQRLSARQRECVVLRYYRCLSDAEIANELGCSVGSVRTHMKRALARLETTLDETTMETAHVEAAR